ncbi:MAG: hypothetical protein ABIB97_04260 [Patescibacteria group bacterium]
MRQLSFVLAVAMLVVLTLSVYASAQELEEQTLQGDVTIVEIQDRTFLPTFTARFSPPRHSPWTAFKEALFGSDPEKESYYACVEFYEKDGRLYTANVPRRLYPGYKGRSGPHFFTIDTFTSLVVVVKLQRSEIENFLRGKHLNVPFEEVEFPGPCLLFRPGKLVSRGALREAQEKWENRILGIGASSTSGSSVDQKKVSGSLSADYEPKVFCSEVSTAVGDWSMKRAAEILAQHRTN